MLFKWQVSSLASAYTKGQPFVENYPINCRFRAVSVVVRLAQYSTVGVCQSFYDKLE